MNTYDKVEELSPQTDTRYPFDPKANAFDLESQEKKKIKNYQLLVGVKSQGWNYICGPSLSYDMNYPEMLTNQVSQEDFEEFIGEVNESVRKFWPCSFTFVLAYTFMLCTLMLSLYLPRLCLNDAQRALNNTIEKWNDKFLNHNVKVVYKRKLCHSEIQFYKI